MSTDMGGPIFTQPVEARDDQNGGFAVRGLSTFANSIAITGLASGVNGVGVNGQGPIYGVRGLGLGNNNRGVQGDSSVVGVEGAGRWGVVGNSSFIGVWGGNLSGGSHRAGYFKGDVELTGRLHKSGYSTFKIDHPLDPGNKYLYHSAVESPDLKNFYDGLVTLDGKGEAKIELPDWFGAVNKDIRYQLTPIGGPGPNLCIAEEISESNTNYSNQGSSGSKKSHFKIAGGTSGIKVSWQVTGIRNDPYAKAYPLQVEEDKPDKERGYYIHPDLFGKPEEKAVGRLFSPELAPEQKKV